MKSVGRPPVEGKPRDIRIVLQALPEEADAWKLEAKRRRLSLSEMIRKLMNASVKRGQAKR